MLETYQDLPIASNKEVIEFLREQIFLFMEKANLKRRIFVAYINEILKEVEGRMVQPCPHGTLGGFDSCMACRPELMEETEKKRLDMIDSENFLKGEL